MIDKQLDLMGRPELKGMRSEPPGEMVKEVLAQHPEHSYEEARARAQARWLCLQNPPKKNGLPSVADLDLVAGEDKVKESFYRPAAPPAYVPPTREWFQRFMEGGSGYRWMAIKAVWGLLLLLLLALMAARGCGARSKKFDSAPTPQTAALCSGLQHDGARSLQ